MICSNFFPIMTSSSTSRNNQGYPLNSCKIEYTPRSRKESENIPTKSTKKSADYDTKYDCSQSLDDHTAKRV